MTRPVLWLCISLCVCTLHAGATSLEDITGLSGSKESRRVMLEDMIQTSKDMLAAGVTPAVAEFAKAAMESIEQSVLKAINDEAAVDQTMLDTFFAAFGKADDDYNRTLGVMHEAEADVESQKHEHMTCRETESSYAKDAEACEDVLAKLWKAVTDNESLVVEEDEDVYKLWCTDPNRDRTVPEFRNQSVLEFNEYISKKADLDQAYVEHDVKLPICQSLRTLHQDFIPTCDTKQGGFETSTCTLADIIRGAQTSYRNSFSKAKQDYELVMMGVKVEEADREVEYVTLQTVLCLLGHIDDETNGSASSNHISDIIDGCANETHSTDDLDIVYKEVPDMIHPLVAMVPYPCTTDFLKNYDAMPVLTEPATCQPCLVFDPDDLPLPACPHDLFDFCEESDLGVTGSKELGVACVIGDESIGVGTNVQCVPFEQLDQYVHCPLSHPVMCDPQSLQELRR